MGSVGQATQGWLPWQGAKSESQHTPSGDVNALGMAYAETGNVQNNQQSWDVWLDSGTWKLCEVSFTSSGYGISTYKFNGVSVGTIDHYSAGLTRNVYTEITGISVTTAGVVTLQDILATKNASSTGYDHLLQSIALIRTSGTASTPAGSDTPGYTWQYLPWMGSKANTGISTRGQNSAYLGGGSLNGTGAQNNTISWDIWLDAGTYKYAQVHVKSTDRGIYTVRLDGSSQGTIDGYVAAPAANTYTELTGITVASSAVARTFSYIMAAKNAASVGYIDDVQSVAWIRTGA